MITLRQEILERLRAGPVGLRELARSLGLREKEAAEHLEHACRSLAHGERFQEDTPQCLACGFAFRRREQLTTPSRCPRCKSERIRPAAFWIEPPDRREDGEGFPESRRPPDEPRSP